MLLQDGAAGRRIADAEALDAIAAEATLLEIAPRFLTRRKPGRLADLPVVVASERLVD